MYNLQPFLRLNNLWMLMARFYKLFFLSILAFSTLVLAMVFSIEFFLNVPPCKLCIYQRLPYFGLLIVGIFGYLVHRYRKINSYLIVMLFLVSVGLSFFNVGIEEQWFNYHSSCISNLGLNATTFEDFKKSIMEKDIVSCDLSTYRTMGLSLAAWNLVASIIMFILSLSVIITFHKKGKYEKVKT